MSAVQAILKTMDYGVAPESNEHVLAWLEKHERRFAHFIGGDFALPAQAEYFDVVDPARGKLLAQCAQGSAADVDAAVAAARKAQKSWSSLSGDARSRYLYAIARILQKRERFFSVLETMDNGKPIRESRDLDIPLAVRHFYHHAGWAALVESEFPGHAPVGVCGQIIPWNFPLLMLAWKVAPALAAGNTVVLKPAEYTPLTALAFAEVCQEAGLPAGVFNVVTGDGWTGAALVEHADVDKIAFTGSTDVGRIIRQATAGTGKKLSLELGGKSPFIVFEDADLDSAVEGVVDAIWFNQGQVCCAGSRLIVQESVAEKFYGKLRARMATLRVGDPLDKSTDIGAIVADVQLERIRRLVEQGRAEGMVCHQPEGVMPEGGLFFPPTLFTGVSPASSLASEEIFGPVLVAMTFRTQDEALQLANNSRYGLAASVWSENINVTLDAAARVQAGVVWVNATNLFDAAAGFGGYKESGFGREGGREGLGEYLVPPWEKEAKATKPANSAIRAVDFSAAPSLLGQGAAADLPRIDRTAKLYIGGKQVRPDSGYSYTVLAASGTAVGQAGLGNRKDIRNAVEAAGKAGAWSAADGP
jgi:aldehyde dehydrogenase (NAD+)